MGKKYVNYYNGEKENFTFFFDGLNKEEAERLQAYLLQDSHFILTDENVLEHLSDKKEELGKDKDKTEGTIAINSDPFDKGHFSILGCSTTIDYAGDVASLIYRGDIYTGLNFVAVIGLVQDEQTKTCRFSEVNWCYEKSVDPTRLTRYNIKTCPLTSINDNLDLEGDDIVYTVSEDFKITDSPKEAFKNARKEVRTKKR